MSVLNPRMPFGKYQGDYLADVPSSYLFWALENHKFDTLFTARMAQELAHRLINEYAPGSGYWTKDVRRDPPGSVTGDPSVFGGLHGDTGNAQRPTFKSKVPPVEPKPTLHTRTRELADEIVTTGYRALAKRYHPDTGMPGDTMLQLNETVGILRKKILAQL